MLGLSWLLVFLIFSKTISVIENIVPSYKANKFDVLNQDRNGYIVIATDYLTTIYFVKTDFLINSLSYMLFDMNLLKNGFTNRFNEKNLQEIKFQSELFYRMLNVAVSLGKISFTLFITFYFLTILFKAKTILKWIWVVVMQCSSLWVLHKTSIWSSQSKNGFN